VPRGKCCGPPALQEQNKEVLTSWRAAGCMTVLSGILNGHPRRKACSDGEGFFLVGAGPGDRNCSR